MAKEEKVKNNKQKERVHLSMFPKNMIGVLADEVATTLIKRLPDMLPKGKKKSNKNNNKKVENGVFLDTSAIIDGRIFDVINLGLFKDVFVIPENILLELKHIADSQDTVKRERGRKGLEMLEKLKRTKGVKVVVLSQNHVKTKDNKKRIEVDEILIKLTKIYHGRIITCDYNLEKKAHIEGVLAVNVNALANCLKVSAVPGEALHIELLHQGKDLTQGVGYLDDGTMVVVENGAPELGRTIDVVVSRVIQTAVGRILFAKKI